jgi:predicted Zn finger-like uncharacterized protein
MRIACPNCHAEYEVPDAMLAGGARQLRCARCGHGFSAALPAETASPPPIPAPALAGPATAPEPDQSAPVAPLAAPVAAQLAEEPSTKPPLADAVPPAHRPATSVPAPAPVGAPASGPDRPPPTRGPLHHSPIDPPEEPTPPPTGRLAAAWLASLALVGAGAAALVVFQAEIVAAWPPAARFYAALGLG